MWGETIYIYICMYVCLHTNEAEKVKHQTQNSRKIKKKKE